MSRKITEVEFISRAIQKHGNIYEYGRGEYINTQTKTLIFCSKCELEFLKIPNHHLRGQGCPSCSHRLKGNNEIFAKRAKLIHGDKYNYSKVDYKTARKQVLIQCNTCSLDFLTTPDNHLRGHGCPRCVNCYPLTTDTFIEKARTIHGDIFDYHETTYKTTHEKVWIICRACNLKFEQEPSSHLSCCGCPHCNGGAQIDTKYFIEKAKKIHGDKIDYSFVDYKNANTKVILHCLICKTSFKQVPLSHLRGTGCPSCANYGFDPNAQGILYYLRISHNNETFYKIGVTKMPINKRYQESDMKKITVVMTRNYDKLLDAYNEEQRIIEEFKADAYKGKPILKAVKVSEIFTRDILGLDVALAA